jgi:hypothetical protein
MRARAAILFILLCFSSQSLWAYTGREIMEKSDALPEAKTAKSIVMMFIHKGDRVIEKEFTILSKKFENDEDKALLSFQKPTRIKLLTHSKKVGDDDQWLRLSSGKVKRIASSDKGKSFVNSHFYYEDLNSRDIDDYEYKYIGDETAVGVDCYKVESIKKAGMKKVYDRAILYVRKSDFFIVRIDFYQKGKFHKYLENSEIQKIDNILTPFRVVMSLENGKGRTELKVKSVLYNTEIKSSEFNKEALR